jgi:hypothetical protein
MRLAEHESEGDNKKLIALIVADMQDPVTPILEAALVGEGLHDSGRMIARLSKVVHHGAAAIYENLLCGGTVEIHLGHVRRPLNGMGSNEIQASPVSSKRGRDDDGDDVAKIWNHIHVVIRV